MEIGVEVGFRAREFITLEAEIHPFLPVTLCHAAIGVPASAVPASFTVPPGHEGEKVPELGIVFEFWHKRGEPVSVFFKFVAQEPFEFRGMFLNVSIDKKHALPAIEATGRQFIQN